MKKATLLLLAVVIAALAYTPNSFRYTSTAGILWDDYDWFLADPARIPLIEGYQLYTNLANFVSGEEHPLSDSIGFQGPGFYLIGGKGWGPPFGAAGVFDTRMLRIADPTGIGDQLGHASEADTNYTVDPDDGSIIGTDISTQMVDAYHTRNDFDGYLGLGYTLGETFSLGLGYYHGSNKISWFPADNNQIISNYSYTTGLDTYDTTYSFNEFTTTEMSNRIKLGAWTEIDYLQLSGYLGAEMFSGDAGRDTTYGYSLSETYGDPATTSTNWIDNLENWRYSGLAFPVEVLGIYELDEGMDLWFMGGFEYNMWNWKEGAGVTNVGADTTLTTSAGITASLNQLDSTLTTGSGKGSGMTYHLGTKGVFELNEKVSFGLGLIFRGSSDKDSTRNINTHHGLGSSDNGDGVPDPTDVIVADTVWTSTDYEINKMSTMAFYVPAGVEFRPIEPLALRLGATYSHRMNSYTTLTQGIGQMLTDVNYENGDGSIIIDTTYYYDYDIGHGEGIQKETIDNVVYDFGIGFKITENLQIDLMGFTDLLDMGNWRLSAIFKF